jgi:hypothetical protein
MQLDEARLHQVRDSLAYDVAHCGNHALLHVGSCRHAELQQLDCARSACPACFECALQL